MAKPNDYTWGVGRRKTSTARVRIREGSGKMTVNGKEHTDYFRLAPDQERIFDPLRALQSEASFDVWANVKGGGTTGQVGAIVMGLARALARGRCPVRRCRGGCRGPTLPIHGAEGADQP